MSGEETLNDKVTNSIIRQLEAGVAPWVKPWSAVTEDVSLPYNVATNREYSGINIPILWVTAIAFGYMLPRWLIFHQASELGGQSAKESRERGSTS